MTAFWRGRKALVTGGRGFVGRFVCRELVRSGAEAIAIGSKDYDLTEQSNVRQMLADHRPSHVFHLAAACGGIAANVANPGKFLVDNALMGLMVLEASHRAGVEKLVLASTTCAYPKDAPMPLREENFWDGPPVGATGPYGMAKRLLHEACRTYEQQYGMHSVVMVLANMYGPEDHFDPENSHVVPGLIRRYVDAVEKQLPTVTNWGTGNATREFLHVRDAARAMVLAAEHHGDPAPVNIGTGIETSIRTLTELVASATGYRGEVRWDASKPDGQPRRYLDVSRARAFGFEAQIPLVNGIAETVSWFRDHARA